MSDVKDIYGDLMNASNRYAVAINMTNFSHGVMDTKENIWVKTGIDFDEADELAYELNKENKQ